MASKYCVCGNDVQRALDMHVRERAGAKEKKKIWEKKRTKKKICK